MLQQTLSRKRIMTFAFAAGSLQFATQIQLSFTSVLFMVLGAHEADLSNLWIVAPVTGLLVQLLLGPLSDHTHSRFGRRRPYLLGSIFLTSISTFGLPLSTTVWFAALQLCLFYCAQNGVIAMIRALTSDLTPDQQLPHMYAMQAVFSALGAMIASLFAWVFNTYGETLTRQHTEIPALSLPIQWLFAIAASVALLFNLYLVFKVQESTVSKTPDVPLSDTHLSIWEKIKSTPPIVKYFFPSHFFVWFAQFALWVYFPLCLAQRYYELPIGADFINHPSYQLLLEKGSTLTAVCYGISTLAGILFSLSMTKLLQLCKGKILFGISLFVGGISLLVILYIKSWFALGLGMLGYGFMGAAMSNLPYLFVTREVPKAKVATYLGLLNVGIAAPQIFCALSVGRIHEHLFHSSAIKTVTCVGCLFIVGGMIALMQARHE